MTGRPRGLGARLATVLALAHAFATLTGAPERLAWAQEPAIIAPSRIDEAPVPYPRGATGSASVVLELRIAKDGTVAECHAIEGEEPFASAAVAAGSQWRFAPATRGGKPAEARIRVRIDFSPAPVPVPAAPPPPLPEPQAAPATPPAAAPAEPGAKEVTVFGTRHETAPGHQEMSGAEVRQLPGSFGDAFRAIEALPGVTPVLSGLPYFLVRGAPPGNTGFFLDGVRVPALFHLGVGAAVIHPGLVDRVDFYLGGYPARFGRFTGGILSGEVLPTPDRPHVEAQLRLLDVGALVSAPFDGGRGDVLASGRYGYPGPLLSFFAPNTGLAYWDYQTRVQWRPDDRNQVGVFAFGSFDSLSQRNTTTKQMDEVLGIQFHRVDLRWDRRTGTDGALRVALTLGYDRSSTNSSSDPTQTAAIRTDSLRLRTEWANHVGDRADVRLGADADLERYDVLLPNVATNVAGAAGISGDNGGTQLQTDFDSGLYGELAWRPGHGLDVRPGLRVDAFTSRSPGGIGSAANEHAVVAWDPRLSVRWQATKAFAALAAAGVVHQASNVPLPSPGLQFSQLSRGLQGANQYSIGGEVKLPGDFTASADVFLHEYSGLADYIESCPNREPNCTFNGGAYGLELFIRRDLTRKLSGWVSYTLSRAERDAFYLGQWIRRLSEFDRTHVVNLVLAADLGARWRAGARVVAYSGLPYSTLTGTEGPPDARGPAFVRLDLRVEKRWSALGGTFGLVIEWLNVLLDKESTFATCQGYYNGNVISTSCGPQVVGPITFPSIGLEAAW